MTSFPIHNTVIRSILYDLTVSVIMWAFKLLTMSVFSPIVPTEALANKLFGAPEPSAIARSLPTTVPDSPNYRSARTPRTPRTPRLKDPTQTPRFYPVVKEGRPLDAKVRMSSRPALHRASLGRESLNHASVLFQTPRKRKTRHSSNPPMECHVGWVMDSREHRSRTASVR